MARVIKYYERGEWKYATVKDIGEISNLMTTNKTDIVSAINEIFAQGGGGSLPPDLEEKIRQLEAITQENKGSIDSIYTDLGLVDEEIASLSSQQATYEGIVQALTIDAQESREQIENTKQDLLSKAEKIYVDSELVKKLSESQYQEDYLATQAKIDEKLDLSNYQNDYESIVADIGSKVDITAFEGVKGRVSNVETSITNINDELEQKVSSVEYESDVGINKWLVTRYTSVLSDMAQFNPEHSMMLQGAIEQETIELLDEATIYPEASNSSIYRFFTNVYTAQSKTIGLTLSYQDSVHILMNGASIYKNKSNAGAGVTTSLSLRKGWNTVEILLGNKDGQPSINFSTILSDMVDKMTTVIGVGDRNEFRLKQAETSIKQNSDEISLRATKTELSNMGNRISEAESELTVQAGQIASKVSQTDFDGYSQRLGEAESTIVQQASQIASKVSQTDYNLLNGKVDEHETEIIQMSDEIALKASQSSVNSLSGQVNDVQSSLTIQAGQIATKVESSTLTTELAKKEGSITKNDVAPSNPYMNQMWLDTSGSISILKSWTGSVWKKATPTSAGEVGAYTKTETDGKVSQVATRLTNAETSITQNQSEIALRATKQEVDVIKTDVGNVVTRVSNAESAIEQNSDEIALRATKTELNGLTGEVDTVKTQLSVQAGEIGLKASKTDVYTKAQTDTKVATKAEQSSLDATNSNLSSVTTRITDAESEIKVNSDEIALRATKNELNTVTGEVNAVKSQLSIQAGQIATKVEGSTLTTELAKKEGSIHKNNVAPSSPYSGQLWMDTSTTLNQLKRWTGSTWAKATPTTAGEVGAYTKAEVDGQISPISNRLTSAETAINQTKDEIALKATRTEVYTKSETDTRVNTKADQSSLNTTNSNLSAVTTRMTNAEADIKVNADGIALRATKADVDNLTGRVSSAESSLSVQAGQIATKVAQSDFNTLSGKVSTAESNITQQASQISLRVEKSGVVSAINQSAESIKILASKIDIQGAVTFSSFDSTMQTKINSIEGTANTARDRTEEMFSDLKVTPLEKQDLKRLWDSIKVEYSQLVAMANTVGSVATTNYTNSYNVLNGNVPRIELDVLASMTTTYSFANTSSRDAFNNKLTTYFTQREALRKAINDRQKAISDGAQSTANTANSLANSLSALTTGWVHPDNTTNIDGGKIQTNSVTASQVSVLSLSALSANIGTVTAGTISGVSFSSMPIVNRDAINRRWTEKTDIAVGNVAFRTSATINTADNNGKVAVQETTLNNDGLLVYQRNDDSGVNSYVSTSGTGIQMGGMTSNLVGVGQHNINADGEMYISSKNKLNITSYVDNVEIEANMLHLKSNGEALRIQGFDHEYISFFNGTQRQGFVGQGSSASRNIDLRAERGNLVLNASSNIVIGANMSVGATDINIAGNGQVFNLTGTTGSFTGYALYARGTDNLLIRSESEIRAFKTTSTAYIPVRASSFPTGSSIRFKDNLEIFTYEEAKEILDNTQVFKYHLKSNLENRIYDKPKIGLISEMVPSQIRDEDGVDVYSITSTLLRINQAHSNEINSLREEVSHLKEEISSIVESHDIRLQALYEEIYLIKESLNEHRN